MKPELAEAGCLYAINGDRKYLNPVERARALTAMASLPADEALFALTLAWAGARVSEVLALTASSVQLDCGTVAIATLKRRRHHVREVPLPPDLLAALDRHFGLSVNRGTRGRLWPWHRTTAWRVIKRVMDRCGVSGRRASPRGLRHAFGIGTLRAGVPLNLIQRWMGHARITTTAIYADACGPEEQEIAARFWQAR